MKKFTDFKNKSFAIYGYGKTGVSVNKFLIRKKIKKIRIWDDNFKVYNKIKKNDFIKNLGLVDFIVISPGINILKSKLKKYLIKYKEKIITDIDLFFLSAHKPRTIAVTGTNGKSTTCSLINHVLKKNGFKTRLVGNIGNPILKDNFNKKTIYIVEVSSFQLFYSKFCKPNIAAILNISNDHIDWHGNKNNYLNAKFKIFENQNHLDHAILKESYLKKIFLKKKLRGKLDYVRNNSIKNFEINNIYLRLKTNSMNVEFAFLVAKKFGIKKKSFLKSIKSFKGLPHRHEIIFKNKNFIFINDSKATSFDSTRFALANNNNIIWILGGQPKLKDKLLITKFKKRIIKAYIIGNNPNYFKRQLINKIKYVIKNKLHQALKHIFLSLNTEINKATILLSPSSASYDQYRNFNERGDQFKKIVKSYAKKFF